MSNFWSTNQPTLVPHHCIPKPQPKNSCSTAHHNLPVFLFVSTKSKVSIKKQFLTNPAKKQKKRNVSKKVYIQTKGERQKQPSSLPMRKLKRNLLNHKGFRFHRSVLPPAHFKCFFLSSSSKEDLMIPTVLKCHVQPIHPINLVPMKWNSLETENH